MEKIQINKSYGYYEVVPKPTNEELNTYYEDKYFQNERSTYAKYYNDEEITYFNNKIAQKDFIVKGIQGATKSSRILDIGCGEGFTLNYYHEKG